MLMSVPSASASGAAVARRVVSFCGVFLIATRGEPARLSFNIGDLMALASMMMWAGYTVLLRLRRDPLDTTSFSSWCASSGSCS
jgi:drug/metabolite transporter (DMT)-like permease